MQYSVFTNILFRDRLSIEMIVGLAQVNRIRVSLATAIAFNVNCFDYFRGPVF